MSDLERSVIMASTDLNGVEKKETESSNPMEAEQKRQEHRQPKELGHCSKANKGVFVWGSSGIYADKIVTNERIKFNVHYESDR
jgi:hypothetical protein